MSVYCTPAELCQRYDKRRVAEIASDTGVPVVDPTLPVTDPTHNLNIAAALVAGTQDFLSAARQSDRYTIAMLDQIYFTQALGVYVYDQRELLISIVSAFAFTRLIARRGLAESELGELSPLWNDAKQTREAFATGQLIIDDPNGLVAAAGVTVAIVPLNPQICSWTARNRLFGAGCCCNGPGWGGGW